MAAVSNHRVYGQAVAEPGGIFSEPVAVTKAIDLYERRVERSREPKDGFYPEFGEMYSGSGWLAVGPGYRHAIAGGRGRFAASAAVSVRLYTMAQTRIEFPKAIANRVTLGGQLLYRDALQVNYFGLGNDTVENGRAGYRLRTTETVGWASLPVGPLTVTGRAGVIPFVSIGDMRGRKPAYPNVSRVYSDTEAPGISEQPSFTFGDVQVSFDTRNEPEYPISGGVYQATWAAYSDRDNGRYSFRRAELEAAHYVPIVPRKWTIALTGWLVGTDTGDDSRVPFYLLPSLGGKNTLRGFADYRFHDRALEYFAAESRFGIFTHVDAAFFVDAGRVASRVGDLGMSDLKSSWGVGVRLHNVRSTVARLDVGRSSEGWHVIFKTTEAFKRSTPSSGKRAIIPFVP